MSNGSELPEAVKDRAEDIKEDNPDMSKSQAIAIARDQLNLAAEYDEITLDEDPCESGYVMVGTKQQDGRTVPNCVPAEDADAANLETFSDDCPSGQVEIGGECVDVEHVDAPAPVLQSQPRIMASASPLDTQPIEREELDGDKVAYRGLKLIDSGVWTDSGSETPTLYDDRTFENTEPEYPNGHDGPPVNIAHDIHKTGPQKGEAHEASIGGYIDPDSLESDGEALFGDVILDRGTDAGAFADTNLQSALENDGSAGFSPSVELMPTELEDADDPNAEEYVKSAELTGLGLVRDPASKSVDLAYETQNRSVAMSANGGSGESGKVLTRKTSGMRELADVDDVRSDLEQYNVDTDDMSDEDVMEFAEALHEDLMDTLDMASDDADDDDDEEDEAEMAEGDDDEEDEDEEKDMMDDDLESMQEQLASLSDRLGDVEDALSETLSEGDVQEELSALAEADTVAELRDAKDDLDKRLSALEEEPAEGKTLADAEGSGIDWSEADDTGVDYDPATGSTHGR